MPAECYGCGKAPGSTANCGECAKTTEFWASCLGGLRALKTYTAEAFKPSARTHEAFIAAKTFDPKRDNLYLWGPCGTGKSHLAAIAARQFLPDVVTVTPLELLAYVMGASRRDEDRAAVIRYARMKVLCIDEIGTGTDSEKTVMRLYDVLNRRYQDRPGGLIVTSNLSLDDLATYLKDDRIPSRLYQMCRVFDFTGEPDHRMEKKQ